MVDYDFPRRRARDHGARDQSAGRLAARRVESETAVSSPSPAPSGSLSLRERVGVRVVERRTKMRLRILGAALCALATTSCQTWGPTWSEVTGARYNRTIADRWPAQIISVGSNEVFSTPFKVAPGAYTLQVESPRHSG